MKIGGKKLEGRNVVLVPIIRNTGNIVFKVEAIADYEGFNSLIPMPIPPVIVRPGGNKEFDIENEEYKKRVENYGEMKMNYTVIASLSGTEGLEWEKVTLDDPRTWEHWRSELHDFGLTEIETVRIVQAVHTANALDEGMIEKARQDFLREAARTKE